MWRELLAEAKRAGRGNTAAAQEAIEEKAAAVEAEAEAEEAATGEAPDNLPVVSCIKSSNPSHNPVPTAWTRCSATICLSTEVLPTVGQGFCAAVLTQNNLPLAVRARCACNAAFTLWST